MYEPEQFPGLIYRMDDPKTVILIFSTGKLVCTGTKKEAEVHEPSQSFKKRLKRKSSSPTGNPESEKVRLDRGQER